MLISNVVKKAVESEKCTVLYGVPTMFIAELNHPNMKKYNVTSLRTGIMGTPLPPFYSFLLLFLLFFFSLLMFVDSGVTVSDGDHEEGDVGDALGGDHDSVWDDGDLAGQLPVTPLHSSPPKSRNGRHFVTSLHCMSPSPSSLPPTSHSAWQCKVVDEKGNIVERNTPGELIIKG